MPEQETSGRHVRARSLPAELRDDFQTVVADTGDDMTVFAEAHLPDGDIVVLLAAKDEPEPRIYTAADSGPHAKEWLVGFSTEYAAQITNGIWDAELPDLHPPRRKAVSCKWVFKVKPDSNGQVANFKARLSAKGCSQKAGVGYGEIFSPVTRHSSLRVMLTIAAVLDMELLNLMLALPS